MRSPVDVITSVIVDVLVGAETVSTEVMTAVTGGATTVEVTALTGYFDAQYC